MNSFNTFLLGMGLAASIGPALIIQIRIAIERGFLQAVLFSLGVVSADCIYMIAIYFGLLNFPPNSILFIVFKVLAIIVFGFLSYISAKNICNFAKKKENLNFDKRLYSKNAYLSGLGINIINPFAVGFWISAFSSLNISGSISSLLLIGGGLLFANIIIGYIFSRIKKENKFILFSLSIFAFLLFASFTIKVLFSLLPI